MAPITALYAAALALLFIGLSLRVITYRRSNRLSLGDEGDRRLLQRMRAQANCAEYAPFGVLLLLLAELQGAPDLGVHALGLTLLAGRVMHAVGFSRRPNIMALRVGGMVLTMTMILVTALGLILHGVT
ncbi:MAG: MAPEG family protein [Paracoccaceae bacterium]|nr:MAPEG family protein [Paracoccaceae bacterium]